MVIEMTLEHILYVTKNMDAEQWAGIACLYSDKSKTTYAMSMFNIPGIKVTVLGDKGILCVGGIMFDGPSRGTLWMAHVEGWQKAMKEILKLVQDVIRLSELRFISALIKADNVKNIRFAEHIGLKKTGFKEAFGDGNEDFFEYTKVNRG